ncbi:rhomboid family intramembrane serine protease [Aestuariibacter salexigens]|uniref:rhomboid family intramembrane serine protease n=1 Tax=Aestuariibacter salexigens TaxID=226010 RepID=UPI0004069434|nr:rhomboid family intramembrane serine protease [Aestuariibacter salexigens]
MPTRSIRFTPLKFEQQIKVVLWVFALLTALEVINLFTGRLLNLFGLIPRQLGSLPGVLFSPFLHGSLGHFLSNIVTLCVFLLLMLQHGGRRCIGISAWIILTTGVLVWLFGRHAVHVGASGVIYGYFGFLLLAGLLSGKVKLILISLAVGFLYGGMVFGVLPSRPFISWESHFFGFVAGLMGAWYWAKR